MKHLISAIILTIVFSLNAYGQDLAERSDCPNTRILSAPPTVYFTDEFNEYFTCAQELIRLQSTRNAVVAATNVLIYRQSVDITPSELICVFNQWPELYKMEELSKHLVACEMTLYFQKDDLQKEWDKMFLVISQLEEKG